MIPSTCPIRQGFCLTAFLRQIRPAKFFLVSCMSITFSLVFFLVRTQFGNRPEDPPVTESLIIREALQNVSHDLRNFDVYRKTSHLPKNLKYLLFWTPNNHSHFYFFGEGQKEFLLNKCSAVNCYVTRDRRFFGADVTKFDAIAFDGQHLNVHDLPHKRSAHQKYIYFNMESPENSPVCENTFDGFFNWTSTYRLNSDIPYPYIMIRNNKNEAVGPKLKMNWLKDMEAVDDKFIHRLVNKSRAAAWFVSHCVTRSYRMEYVLKLQQALEKYRYNVDIYGNCGNLKCSKWKSKDCYKMLSSDYYFYMAMENCFSEDYVTEKLLTALKHDVVPIVYGGADYSRFLPPGSYIDARKYEPKELAALMNKLIHSPRDYISYSKWRNHYNYRDPTRTNNICTFCGALNNETMLKVSVYKEFREWWYPEYKKEERCNRNKSLGTKK